MSFFWMTLYRLHCVLEVQVLLWTSFDHGYDLEREHFSADIRVVSISVSYVSVWKWSEWMRCHVERGYGNLTPRVRTLWVRVKRHAIHHWLYKLCTEDMWKVTARSHGRGREHSTYCGKNLVCDHPVSQYSIGLRTCHFRHQDVGQ